MTKKCYILAGPNGAGKTTFASEFLPIEVECLNFVNADLIAQGLSPFQPAKMAVEAGRLMIQHINDCVRKNESFAFETTLSGKGYIKKINEWKKQGYEIIIYFFNLPSVEFAIERVKLRVAQGGTTSQSKIFDDVMKEAGTISTHFTSHWLIHGLFLTLLEIYQLLSMNRSKFHGKTQ